jgi:hypothetical protein
MDTALIRGARSARLARSCALACTVGLLLPAGLQAAHAALPDEIQVYVDDLNDPGQWSLQEHVNATLVGDPDPDYPGESLANHGVRLTSEFAYGLTRDLEAGAYLPVVIESSGDVRLAGVKLRLKWVPIKPAEDGAGMFAGLNGELSQVQYRYDDNRRGFELRPILGWRNADWLFATNPVLEFSLEGPEHHQAPSFAPSFKVARTVARGIAAGFEYYTDLGPISNFDPYAEQQHTVYLAIDIDRKPWNINFGVGRGLTTSTDRWTIKMIINVPLGN